MYNSEHSGVVSAVIETIFLRQDQETSVELLEEEHGGKIKVYVEKCPHEAQKNIDTTTESVFEVINDKIRAWESER